MSLGHGVWAAGGSSVRGASHVRRDMPNQDALALSPSGPGGKPTLDAEAFIAAIADGHGAPAYHHSDIGSRLAVDCAIEALRRFVGGGGAEGMIEEILARWRAAVMADHQARAQGGGGGDWVEASTDVLIPYGATLAAVAMAQDQLLVLQIGDSDVLFGYPDGRIERPLPVDHGLVGEQTYSLCALDAALRFRARILVPDSAENWPDFVMLSTDGIAKSFADEKAFLAIARQYRETLQKVGLTEVLGRLDDWLAEVSKRGSGDDVTLCLASRTPGRAPTADDDSDW
ncbi:MAG: protein phosphatase 2C domain-containing protein [Alphaproteobacteria bacterium]|nr:protein phosphatase 2C domain-containing protein [Alphaproteobacteria bacterium]